MGESSSKRVVGQQFVGLRAPVSFLTSFPVHWEPKQGGDGRCLSPPLPQTLPVTRNMGEPWDRGSVLMPGVTLGGSVLGKPRGAPGTGDACGRRRCRQDTAAVLPAGLRRPCPKQLARIYCKRQPGRP